MQWLLIPELPGSVYCPPSSVCRTEEDHIRSKTGSLLERTPCFIDQNFSRSSVSVGATGLAVSRHFLTLGKTV